METQSAGTLQSTSTFSSSSKFDSLASSRSGASASAVREEDFTKDNVTSPVDMECYIQLDRISKMLDVVIYKTKLSICLPILVKENKTLRSTLSRRDYDDVVYIYEQYENPLFSTSIFNMDAMEDIRTGNTSIKHRLNPELAHLIYILNSYPRLRPIVEQNIQQMKSTFSLNEPSSPKPEMEYLLTLEHARDLLLRQLATTAAEELASKINTKKLEASNAKLILRIEDKAAAIKEENEQFEKTMAKKTAIITELEEKLKFLSYEVNAKLQKLVLDSERQMVLASRQHEVKYAILEEEQQASRETYQKILKSHMIDEKNQRARRFKCETQLQTWLQKYDVDMSEKQSQLDQLTDSYEEQLKLVEGLEKDLAEQDKEYIPLMDEKEKEYHEEMAAKQAKFMLDHAARVIQVAWKNVLANRLEKKKLRKLIKKMQDDTAKFLKPKKPAK